MPFTEEDYKIANTPEVQKARARLLSFTQLGQNEQKRLIRHCASNIPVDTYVPPHLMEFVHVNETDAPIKLRYAGGGLDEALRTVRLHPHALAQLCAIADLPAIWRNKLDVQESWRRELLVHDLNTLYGNTRFLNARKQPAKFLHRKVGDELRAVLTQSYNRHLVSAAVLQPFLAACEEVGLQPARATVTDLKVGLQTYLPYAFEPIPGEFIALGCWWGNSDFGQGKLRVSHTVMRLSNGGSLLTEDSFSRVHLGSVVTESDLKLSDEVAVRELEAVAAATRSAVKSAMEPEQVGLVLGAIVRAHEAQITWAKLKEGLNKFLTKDEVGDMESLLSSKIEELPRPGVGADGEILPSRWWAAAAVAHLAEKQVDDGRAAELKQAAGQYLEAS